MIEFCTAALTLGCPSYPVHGKRKGEDRANTWLSSLKTATPQEGFDLATKLARVGIKVTQPSAEVRDKLRAANDYWRD